MEMGDDHTPPDTPPPSYTIQNFGFFSINKECVNYNLPARLSNTKMKVHKIISLRFLRYRLVHKHLTILVNKTVLFYLHLHFLKQLFLFSSNRIASWHLAFRAVSSKPLKQTLLVGKNGVSPVYASSDLNNLLSLEVPQVTILIKMYIEIVSFFVNFKTFEQKSFPFFYI